MYRHRHRMIGSNRVLIISLAALAVASCAIVIHTALSNAGESCASLDRALQSDLNVIAGLQSESGSQSTAQVANRQSDVDLINQRRQAAGCFSNVVAEVPVGAPAAPSSATEQQPPADSQLPATRQLPAVEKPPAAAERPAAQKPPARQKPPAATKPAPSSPAADVVCRGSTVTLSGERGGPSASSNQFPVGTKLKVTNLNNKKSTTVAVTGPSGSCILLNQAAFELVRDPGEQVILHALIERVG
jgi:hypothetical protein